MAENYPRARGRPAIPESEIRQKVNDITLSLLLNQGYSKTTMDVIAQKAKIAKKTLYRFYKNREELIEKVILNWKNNTPPSLTEKADTSHQVIILLEKYLKKISDNYLSENEVRLFKLLQSDFPHRNKLLEKYQKNGIESSKVTLANWLDNQQKQGLLKESNYNTFSELAISMVISEPLRKMVLGLIPPLPETDVSPRITEIVKLISVESDKK
ncbi:TetR/AcrR family transcriptional regulator [Xenorhabdus innexi]|uniref:Intercellular adhesion regulator n=1 Tax=Xenorhabdus innexi TaxID=290109 RepID=A0A1N6N1G5_9GAMM|nr:TetR/AcrR family transcriptional regulator [Xenorhabdus innexi]PHM37003.1 intercellular adhesion regulator [Xenorhabdus innexi]SIP74917.1 putative transcriptional regulator, TetR family [Xenorhabdus innexi]